MDILCKFLKQVGPTKRVGWGKKAVNLKRVGLRKVEKVEKLQVGWGKIWKFLYKMWSLLRLYFGVIDEKMNYSDIEQTVPT